MEEKIEQDNRSYVTKQELRNVLTTGMNTLQRKYEYGKKSIRFYKEAPDDDEPVRPEWMDTKKKEDLTEEEQYQIAEFEKKLKNFIEEREKRRKALSAELTKLVNEKSKS